MCRERTKKREKYEKVENWNKFFYIFLDVSVACLPFVQIIFIFICSTMLYMDGTY